MVINRLDKDAIQVLREEMVRSKIQNCASGWYEYEGKLYELILILRKEELSGSLLHKKGCGDSYEFDYKEKRYKVKCGDILEKEIMLCNSCSLKHNKGKVEK